MAKYDFREPEDPIASGEDQEKDTLLPNTATIGNVVLFCAAFSTVISLIWKFIPAAALPFAKSSILGFSLINLVRLFLSLLLPIIFFSRRYRISDTLVIGRNPGLGAVILSFLIGCPASLILVSMHNLLVHFLVTNGITLLMPTFFYGSEDISTESRLLAFTAAFLIPVLLQELFFRGLFFAVWPRSRAVFLKILLSGLLFAVFMQNPVDFLPLLLLGILLAYVRQSTGHFLCPVITQISMLLTYYVFSSLLPYQDYIKATVAKELDFAFLYTAAAAVVMSLLAFLPVLSQLRRMSRDAAAVDLSIGDTTGENTHGLFGWSLGLGLILFAVSWVLLLGI